MAFINITMTSREAIAKLNVLSSYETSAEKREQYKECINAIIIDLDTLDILKEKEKLFINNMKNVLEIEKENVRKETIEKDLKETERHDK